MVDGLKGRMSIAAVVCADASLAHQSLARKLGFPLKELTTSAGQYVREEVFHIQHVNAYHSHLNSGSKVFFMEWQQNTSPLSWLASYAIRAL
ncbi:hypothetical protein CI610_03292 [invertebrate metagenome]|uniref:Uncharacterized protein n=1 Tax=invertebrate metagenome TaxID=1711999 RepID=A0A2H9T3I4_9ZZZZ